MLVPRAVRASEAVVPQSGIDLGNGGAPGRNVPAVERPEVHALAQPLADVAEPRNTGMSGCRDLSIYSESEYRFCGANAALDQAAPVSVPTSLGAIADGTGPHIAHPNTPFICRPMLLKIVEESGPVRIDATRLEIAHRERKAVVDADNRRSVFGELLD